MKKMLKNALVGALLMAASAPDLPVLATDDEVLTCVRDLTEHGLPPHLVAEYCGEREGTAEPTAQPEEAAPVPEPAALVFRCTAFNGSPTTMVQTQRGDLPLIAWRSEYFSNSGYSPQARCQIVSDRFQEHAERGNLRYISHGVLNAQKVLCVADRGTLSQQTTYHCQQPLSESLLLTLEAKDDPEAVLSELFEVSSRPDPGKVVFRGGPQPRFGIDLERVLEAREPVAP